MKASKLSTTLFTVSIIAMMILVFDITSYLRGKNGYLIGKGRSHLVGNIENKNELDKKLNEISNSIISLSTRLSRIEESISKMDRSFEKKVIYPLRNEKSSSSLKQSYDNDEVVPDFSRRRESLSRLRKGRDVSGTNESLDGDDNLFDHVHHRRNSRKWHKSDENTMNILTPKSSLNNVFHDAENSNWHRKPRHSHVLGHNHRFNSDYFPESPNKRDALDNSLIKSDGRDYNGSHGKTYESSKYSLKYSNPPTFPRRALLRKVSISVEPKRDFSRFSKTPYFNGMVNLDDLFSGIGKDSDSVVEVKRFDNLDSFRNFTKNQSENTANEENDNAVETSFFKMSDIIGRTSPSERDKKNSSLSSNGLIDFTKMVGQKSNASTMSADSHEMPSKDSANAADNNIYGSRNGSNSLNNSFGSSGKYNPKGTANLSGISYDSKSTASTSGTGSGPKSNTNSFKDSYILKNAADDAFYIPKSNASLFDNVKQEGNTADLSSKPNNNTKMNENSNAPSKISGTPANLQETISPPKNNTNVRDNTSSADMPSGNEKTMMSIFINADAPRSEIKDFETKSSGNPVATEFCESFSNPYEAFRSGKCVYRNVTASNADPLSFGLGDELSLNPEDFINTIHATIKNMEESIKPYTGGEALANKNSNWAEKKISGASNTNGHSGTSAENITASSKESGNVVGGKENKTLNLPSTDSKKPLIDDEIQKPTLIQPSV
ncbi:uncharacterized protein VICG_00190 [Vittaforma corneae ATCC 50505]|uniref:Uncharacterized protein n=1 Tax=Vittaforma corneae (strain ATCC 50505) TaxID=993615 RepID=L2GQT3_VITCO|nr:uncharacterized protein VICG_00190 [Vittaforma corneae ATCC 50505]ELA42875.1 hypothetical protein VICG_00190 [Vittaforma corneae ATCC 50505]